MMFILQSTHDRVLAERDEARAKAEATATTREFWRDVATRHSAQLTTANAELADLRARLAKWEGPRERGAGGRFLKRADPA